MECGLGQTRVSAILLINLMAWAAGAEECCQTVFLSARGQIEAEQSAVLGKYTLSEDEYNGKVYYSKTVGDQELFLYFKARDRSIGGSSGWTIGPVLNGSMFNVATRNSAVDCPEGIAGAYDRDETRDETFHIECHSEEVHVECCSKVWVNASETIMQNQGARIGLYEQMDQPINGHPVYHLKQYGFDNYLYFQKEGRSFDGWTIDGDITNMATFSITTRSRSHCPDQVERGYDRNKDADETFSITCDAPLPTADEPRTQRAEDLGEPTGSGSSKRRNVDAGLLILVISFMRP